MDITTELPLTATVNSDIVQIFSYFLNMKPGVFFQTCFKLSVSKSDVISEIMEIITSRFGIIAISVLVLLIAIVGIYVIKKRRGNSDGKSHDGGYGDSDAIQKFMTERRISTRRQR